MNIIKPKKLQKGDTIGIIAPAGKIDIEKVLKAKKYFENLGYKVKLGKNIGKRVNYMSGTDEERLFDLHEAFADDEIDAIVCARGGYGALRLINKIDGDLIKSHPKIFCGYSDITVLNAVFLKKYGLITFSGAMAQGDFGSDEVNPLTEKYFFETLTGNMTEISPAEPIIYREGSAEGIVFGGNLATLSCLCGVDFIPDEKFIFFTEDLNEPAYKIDRYFTQLLNIEKFKKNVSAVVAGDFLDLDNESYFNDVINSVANELKIPVIGGFPFSHSFVKHTVPYGIKATLSDCRLCFDEYVI